MAIETKVTCDGCGHEWREAEWIGIVLEYRLCLYSEELPGVATVLRYPEIEHTHHFCRLDCLRKWLKEE